MGTKRPGPPSPTRKSSLPTPSKSALSSGSENVILKGFQVTVGRDGTKDTVKAKVCTPDQKLCCETLELKARTGNNWVRNGNTTWKGAPLGLCRDMQFPTKSRTTITNLLETKLIVTLSKTGKDGMKLDKFTLDAETSSGALPRRFKCGKINVLDSNKAQKECYAQFPKSHQQQQLKNPKPQPDLHSDLAADNMAFLTISLRSLGAINCLKYLFCNFTNEINL